jgi:hypothetical protein
MRNFLFLGMLSVIVASQAFATNPNSFRANFWQLHFDSNYGGDPTKPVVYVQAHVGEVTYRNDSQGNPTWDSNSALVQLNSVGDHFYASYQIEHNTGPYMTGGYKAPVVQYHYFLQGEEAQIDPNNGYSGGHWTAPVIYADRTANQTGEFVIANVVNTNDPNAFAQAEAQAAAALATDAQATSVVEVKCDFAD